MSEPTQVAMVLGQSARDRGARCDQIPDTTPGAGYVAEDGTADLIRVRAFNVTDADIDHLAADYPARAPVDMAKQQPDPAQDTGDNGAQATGCRLSTDPHHQPRREPS